MFTKKSYFDLQNSKKFKADQKLILRTKTEKIYHVFIHEFSTATRNKKEINY